MKNVIVVPDIHGRTFWNDLQGRDLSKVDKVVFLGDYLDPYAYEHITQEEAIDNFKEIIAFSKDSADKVVMLLGNHDWTYIMPEKFYASRHDIEHEDEIRQLFMNNIDLFQMVYDAKVGKQRYIFSHAGIHPEWTGMYLGMEKIDQVIELYNRPVLEIPTFALDSLDCVSSSRGGFSAAGSMTWADVSEFAYCRHDDSYFQVFGHTQQPKEPIITSHYACLDCRKMFAITAEPKDDISVLNITEQEYLHVFDNVCNFALENKTKHS